MTYIICYLAFSFLTIVYYWVFVYPKIGENKSRRNIFYQSNSNLFAATLVSLILILIIGLVIYINWIAS
jgi:hypothetical protein